MCSHCCDLHPALPVTDDTQFEFTLSPNNGVTFRQWSQAVGKAGNHDIWAYPLRGDLVQSLPLSFIECLLGDG